MEFNVEFDAEEWISIDSDDDTRYDTKEKANLIAKNELFGWDNGKKIPNYNFEDFEDSEDF